jgi:hypothetical protein
MQTFPSRKGGGAAAVSRFPSRIAGGSWPHARWRRRRSLEKEVAAGEKEGDARVPELRARRQGNAPTSVVAEGRSGLVDLSFR